MLHASETTNNNSQLPILETHRSSTPVFQGNACTACAPWSGHFHNTAELPRSSRNLSGLPEHLRSNHCCNSSQGTTYPEILDKWPKCSKAANWDKSREAARHQLEKPSAQSTEEIMCTLIPSWHCQHRNKWHFFRVSSKHLLSQTNDFLIATENNLKKNPSNWT